MTLPISSSATIGLGSVLPNAALPAHANTAPASRMPDFSLQGPTAQSSHLFSRGLIRTELHYRAGKGQGAHFPLRRPARLCCTGRLTPGAVTADRAPPWRHDEETRVTSTQPCQPRGPPWSGEVGAGPTEAALGACTGRRQEGGGPRSPEETARARAAQSTPTPTLQTPEFIPFLRSGICVRKL